MKLSIQTGDLPKRFGAPEAFRMIADAGFDCVDFNLDSMLGLSWEEIRSAKPSPFFSDPAVSNAYLEEIEKAIQETGVTIGQVHAPFPCWFRGLEEANANLLTYTKQSIEMCARLGCRYIIIHPLFEGSMRLRPTSAEEEWEVNIAFYRELIPCLKENHVVCCLENMWGQDWRTKQIYQGICSNITEACRYIDTLNEMAGERLFGFCLDIGHLTLVGIDTYEAIKELGHDRLVTLHIHDNRGYDDDHVIPYGGVTIWERFLRGLHEIDYAGTLNFETFGQYKLVPEDFIADETKMIGMVAKYFDRRLTAMKSANN